MSTITSSAVGIETTPPTQFDFAAFIESSVEPENKKSKKSKGRLRKTCAVLLAAAGITVGSTLFAGDADAAAWTKNVYAPHNVSGNAEGWADVVQDCPSDGMGCWNYMKIERWHWYGNEYIDGGWVTGTGWQSITAALPDGCGYYRTVVDSYTRQAGAASGGLGAYGAELSVGGERVYTFHPDPAVSNWSYLCS